MCVGFFIEEKELRTPSNQFAGQFLSSFKE
jgi:hypothetical protein